MKNRLTFTIYSIALLLFSSLSVTAQTFEVDTLLWNAPSESAVNLVILGDGYTDTEQDLFVDDAKNINTKFFDQSPFKEYKAYFNVIIIKVVSEESGAALDPSNLINNYFGSTFGYAGIDRLLVPTKKSTVYSVLADNFPEYDQVVMVVNSSKYGGSGGTFATASTNSSVIELVLHELGHSFSDLGDEYWAGSNYARERKNMTQETNLDLLKWKNWHGDNGIGLYPHSESPTWYRPHQRCKMRYLGDDFCSVCKEGIIETIHSLTDPIVETAPVSNEILEPSYPLHFSLDLLLPEPNTLEIEWTVNGTIIENTESSYIFEKAVNGGGVDIIRATVTDATSLVRVDNYKDKNVYYQEWTIDNENGTIETKIYLDKGWNLISLPIAPSESEVAVVFPNASTVKTFDVSYNSSEPDYLNSLNTVKGGVAYLVYNELDEELSISGYELLYTKTALVKGWNLLGVPTNTNVPLNNLPQETEVVKDFNNFYSPSNTLNSLEELKVGNGYFIKVSEDCEITW